VAFALARTLERGGELDAASAQYAHAETLLPQIGAAGRYRFEHAVFLLRRGETESARELLDKAFTTDLSLTREAHDLFWLADPSGALFDTAWPKSVPWRLRLLDLLVAADSAQRTLPERQALDLRIAQQMQPLLEMSEVELERLAGAFRWAFRRQPLPQAIQLWKQATAVRGLGEPAWPEVNAVWDTQMRGRPLNVGFAWQLSRGAEAEPTAGGFTLRAKRRQLLLSQPVVLEIGQRYRLVAEGSMLDDSELRVVLRRGRDQLGSVVLAASSALSEVVTEPIDGGPDGARILLADLQLESFEVSGGAWAAVISRVALLPIGSNQLP
jgi:hypothetical protein